MHSTPRLMLIYLFNQLINYSFNNWYVVALEARKHYESAIKPFSLSFFAKIGWKENSEIKKLKWYLKKLNPENWKEEGDRFKYLSNSVMTVSITL